MADTPTLDEVRTWPGVVNVEQAGRALGIGRSVAYRLARENRFPEGVRVLRFETSYRVVTSSLIALLESADDGTGPDAA